VFSTSDSDGHHEFRLPSTRQLAQALSGLLEHVRHPRLRDRFNDLLTSSRRAALACFLREQREKAGLTQADLAKKLRRY
jgi:ribosome-binding protein aMBF1 (putative translation factor)